MKINDSFKPLTMSNNVNAAGSQSIGTGLTNFQPSKRGPCLTPAASTRIDRQYKEMTYSSSAIQVSEPR